MTSPSPARKEFVIDLTDVGDDAIAVQERVHADTYAFENDFLTFYAGGLGAVASFATDRVLGVRMLEPQG